MAIHIEFEDGTTVTATEGRIDDHSLEYVDPDGERITVSLAQVRAIRQDDEVEA